MDKKIKRHIIIKKTFYAFLILLLMWLSFGTGLYIAGKNETIGKLAEQETVFIGKVLGKYSEIAPGKLSQDIDFNLFWEVWDTLFENYVDKEEVTDKKLFYGALRGMVSSLDDPYSVFMNPKTAKEFSEDLAGTFEGIGAEIGIKNDILTIIAPLPEMPAEKAGLIAGDKVFAIDGESTAGILIDEAVNKIRGEDGTQVILSISRNSGEVIKDITITRGKIVVHSIMTNLRDDNIFVVKVTNFNDDTQDLFNKAVNEALGNNPRGIIIDLRNNPGGYLDTAIEMASEWVEEGVVVTEKYSEEKLIEHLARGRARLKGFPTVVLVNQGSASASEIVSGALQDYGLATIIGKTTFGKGSVQTLSKFSDGSSVKVTVAKWLTPNGRSINDDGIEPDVTVDLTADDFVADIDPQMDKAIEILIDGLRAETATTSEEVLEPEN